MTHFKLINCNTTIPFSLLPLDKSLRGQSHVEDGTKGAW